MNIPKILAPAGSFETLQAVLDCGADEVYIGGKDFSARQNATNFSNEEILEASRKCHLYGAKLHVAVNTLLFDSQLDQFVEYIKFLARAKVDALIVQDLGALKTIKSVVPNMELHASTQLTVHSTNGALLMKYMGFKRVVVSRELSKETIAEICSLGLDVEVFVHGALCMSMSGQCYLSAMIGSRSANRGLCGQPCRLPFSACGNKEYHALSLKDMSLIEHAKELAEMGVTSLKIEGRMKRPEYSAFATATLKTALNGGTPDMQTLKSIFSRGGFTDGYYTNTLKDMFGVRSKEDVVSMEKVLPTIKQMYSTTRKVSTLYFNLNLEKDNTTILTATDNTSSYTVYGEVPQIAINKPTTKEVAEKQLSKLGNTIYQFGGLTFSSNDNLMLPASSLNELRRKLIDQVNDERIITNEPFYNINRNYRADIPYPTVGKNDSPTIRVRIKDFNQLNDVDYSSIEYVIAPLEKILSQKELASKWVKKLIMLPPRYIDDELDTIEKISCAYIMGIKDIMCTNVAYIVIGNRLGLTTHGDFGLNVLNSMSLSILQRCSLVDCIVSFELKLTQIEHLKKTIPIGIEAYGRLPLMLTKNCPIKNEVGCKQCKHSISDRTNRSFPVYCSNGYSEVFNAETMSIADRVNDIHNVDYYVLSFLDETSKQVANTIQSFKLGKKMGTTKGLYVRGIL